MVLRVGVRWDDPIQNERIQKAHQQGLIDYIEVNYPIPFGSNPHGLGIPVLAHTSSNPTCSAEGVNLNIARRIKEAADETNSPWIGDISPGLAPRQPGHWDIRLTRFSLMRLRLSRL